MGAVIPEVIAFQGFFGFGRDCRLVKAEVLHTKRDVFFNQRKNDLVVGVLKHKADFLTNSLGLGLGVQPIHGDRAAIWQKQPVQKPHKGAFAAAIAADDANAAFREAQRDHREHNLVVVGDRDVS